jgi:hypothetical protein
VDAGRVRPHPGGASFRTPVIPSQAGIRGASPIFISIFIDNLLLIDLARRVNFIRNDIFSLENVPWMEYQERVFANIVSS